MANFLRVLEIETTSYRTGISMDFYEAAKYFKLSADQGCAASQFAYGLCLEYERGASIDLNEAAKYYKLSAGQGHAPPSWRYGMLLTEGKGLDWDVH
jgi:TPR repeat protein